MLLTMSAATLYDWINFSELEPFGARVDEMRLGALRAQLVNRHLKQGVKPYKPSDFLVTVAPVKVIPKVQTANDVFEMFKGYFSE